MFNVHRLLVIVLSHVGVLFSKPPPMLSDIITQPIAIALWGVCGAAVIVVGGIFLFVIWQAKKSTRKEEESARSSAALVDIRDENGEGGGGRMSGDSRDSEEARESPTGSRNSDTPSVFIVIPAVDDHDEDEEKYFGGDAHHILENRSSVTEIFMRLSKSHSVAGEGIAGPSKVHKNLKKSLDFNSNNLTKYLDHSSDGNGSILF